MELIVAVYENWGIGRNGTQPVTLAADRAFFRETTRGAAVIVGRRTLADFPGGRPLPGRVNIVLSRLAEAVPGATLCRGVDEALAAARQMERVFVIGGGSVYRQMLPYCDTAYVTKLRICPESDTFFPNLDADPRWKLAQICASGTEREIPYQICQYRRV